MRHERTTPTIAAPSGPALPLPASEDRVPHSIALRIRTDQRNTLRELLLMGRQCPELAGYQLERMSDVIRYAMSLGIEAARQGLEDAIQLERSRAWIESGPESALPPPSGDALRKYGATLLEPCETVAVKLPDADALGGVTEIQITNPGPTLDELRADLSAIRVLIESLVAERRTKEVQHADR